jgi:hypothetical protein
VLKRRPYHPHTSLLDLRARRRRDCLKQSFRMDGQMMSMKDCGSFHCSCGCGCAASSMKNEENQEQEKGTRQNPLTKELGVDDYYLDLEIALLRLSLDVANADAANVADGAA